MPHINLKKDYKHYPEYKDSGVEWLGEVPKEWQVERNKTVFSFKKEIVGNKKNDFKILSLTLKGVIPRDMENNEGKFPADYGTYQIAQPNDLVMCLFDMDVTPRTVGYVGEVGLLTSAYRIFKPKQNVNTKYYYYYQLALDNTKELLHFTGGLRNSISKEFFLSMLVPVPLFEEQTKIASYLDEKMVLIDAIIQKKEKLIELLREKRTAVINRAISSAKGETGKIKHFVGVNPSKKSTSSTAPEELVSFVPMEALSENGRLSIQEKPYKDVKDGFTYFRDRDVVLAKITPCYENGKAGVMKGLKNGFGFGTTEFLVLRTNNEIFPDYLYFLIFSDKFRKSGEVEMRGTAGQKRVTSSFVRNYEFILPSIIDQQKIVKELTERTNLIDEAFEMVEKSIEHLHEFKSSLISHVVTGKIKV